MGFITEEISLDFGSSHRDVNAGFKISIVSDTINPSTPKKVEGTVSANTAVQQNSERENQESTQQESDEVSQSETQVEGQQSHAIDTLPPVKPRVANTDARSTTALPMTDTTKVSTQFAGGTASSINTDLAIREKFLQDSVARVDSINLAQAAKVREQRAIYSYADHKEGAGMPIKLDRSDGIFILLLVCFLLLAHIYNGGITFFKENIMLVFSASKSEKLETQATTKELFYSYFLVFLAILLISISLYEGLNRFIPLLEGEDKGPFVTIGLFILLISVFLIFKMIFNKFIGYIFDFGKRITIWNQSYLVLLSMLGLLCFLPTLLLVYSNLGHSIIIGFVLILFLIVQIILFLRIIVFFIEQKFNFLYLIAYLCTVEILPYIFLGIGLVYLYKIDIFNTIL